MPKVTHIFEGGRWLTVEVVWSGDKEPDDGFTKGELLAPYETIDSNPETAAAVKGIFQKRK